MNALMSWRARGLVARLIPLLPRNAKVLDIGCGTGHNGERLRRLGLGPVAEADVVDFKVVGPRPTLFDGRALPFADEEFDVVTLIYVLHYARDPIGLLQEARRVCRGPLLVVQTLCEGSAGPACHHFNEGLSRLGFYVARFLRAFRHVACPLNSGHDFSSGDFRRITAGAGLSIREARMERHLRFSPLSRITCKLEPLGRFGSP